MKNNAQKYTIYFFYFVLIENGTSAGHIGFVWAYVTGNLCMLNETAKVGLVTVKVRGGAYPLSLIISINID